MGQVRARANCLRGGSTEFGQTDFTNIIENEFNLFGDFEIAEQQAVPTSLSFTTGNNAVLFGQGTFFQLEVIANYADGSRLDVTRRDSGINYVISNPEKARVDDNGFLQVLESGRVMVTARMNLSLIHI